MISRSRLLLVVPYLLMIAGIIVGMVALRRHTLEVQGSPEAIAQWQAWRAEAAQLSEEGPVRRKVPKSDAPPAYILMRDSFPVLLTASLLIASALYFLLAWILTGIIRQQYPDRIPETDPPANTPGP